MSAALLCLSVNLALFAGIAVKRPNYLRDYRENANPDANHYVLLGHNVLLRGEYSRCSKPPYVPDMVRTPIYPLFAGTLDLLGAAGTIYLVQAFLQAGSCILLFALVRPCFGSRVAFWSSLLLAADLMLAIYNFEAMSEPLFVFLLLASFSFIVPTVLRLSNGESGDMVRLAVGGTLLGLTILTRPVALYLPVLLIGSVFVLGWQRKNLRRSILAATILLVAIAPLPAIWTARNAKVFSLPRFVPVDSINKVYYAGAGAYQLHFNISFEEAQDLIAREYNLPPAVAAQNPWISDLSQREIDAELRRAAFPVLSKYPLALVQSSVLGIVKASFSHNVTVLADLLGRTWIAPSTAGILRLRPEAQARLAENGPWLIAAFFWQMLHVSLSLILAVVGIIVAVRDKGLRPAAHLFLAVLAYFYLTVAMFGFEAFYRCRVPALPFLYTFAAVGMARLGSLGTKVLFARKNTKTDFSMGGQG